MEDQLFYQLHKNLIRSLTTAMYYPDISDELRLLTIRNDITEANRIFQLECIRTSKSYKLEEYP